MLDARLRPLIDRPLAWAAAPLAARGITADRVTVAGFVLGLAGAGSIAIGWFGLALALVAANRIADGIDGAIARIRGTTERGGFLDISLDFAFYAAVPVAFAVYDPIRNGLAAALLVATFLVNGGAFLAFAAMAAKRGLETKAQGEKSIFYLAGLAEGAETIAVFVAMCLWPNAFPWLAAAFAALCLVSGAARIIAGSRTLR